MVTKGASNGIPSLHARKRRNMVKEMNDQLLETPNKPVDDEEESDKSDENSDEDVPTETNAANAQAGQHQFRSPLVNNFMDPTTTNTFMQENG